jgi:hypothetical protein
MCVDSTIYWRFSGPRSVLMRGVWACVRGVTDRVAPRQVTAGSEVAVTHRCAAQGNDHGYKPCPLSASHAYEAQPSEYQDPALTPAVAIC